MSSVYIGTIYYYDESRSQRVRFEIESVTDFYLEVAKGNVEKHSLINKFGRNDDIDSGSGFEDIWAAGGVRTYLTAAETMDIVSDDADDISAGAGARTFYIEGLDSNYDETSETITLNGTTPVTTSNSYLRVHRCIVKTAGSSMVNEGNITVDPTTSGSGARQALIAAGDGQTLIGHYTIPNNKTAYMVGAHAKVSSRAGGTGVKEAVIQMLVREENAAWHLQMETGGRSDGSGVTPELVSKARNSYAAKTEIRWRADADNNNTSVYVEYTLILVED